MIKIAICDDIPDYLEIMGRMISNWSVQRRLNIHLQRFLNGETLLADMETFGDYDIIFLDICMNGIDGLKTASLIRNNNIYVTIIFVSQFEQYCMEAFEVRPFHYLWKPVSEQKLYEIMDKAMEAKKLLYEAFTFCYKRITYSVTLPEVLYFCSDRRKIRVILTNEREYVFYERLDRLENELSQYASRFLRIHKSFLVNARFVEQFHYREVVMKNGNILPVSLEKREMVSRYHMELLENMK